MIGTQFSYGPQKGRAGERDQRFAINNAGSGTPVNPPRARFYRRVGFIGP